MCHGSEVKRGGEGGGGCRARASHVRQRVHAYFRFVNLIRYAWYMLLFLFSVSRPAGHCLSDIQHGSVGVVTALH